MKQKAKEESGIFIANIGYTQRINTDIAWKRVGR